jgi:hypothetical protein
VANTKINKGHESTTSTETMPPTFEEECLPCQAEETTKDDVKCKTCIQAAFHAVKYMRNHVKDALSETYFLWVADATILIIEGLILGVKDSGFKIEIDYNELNDTITFWSNKLIGPQIFFVTRFLAKLGVISIGVTWYLFSFCIDTTKIMPE